MAAAVTVSAVPAGAAPDQAVPVEPPGAAEAWDALGVSAPQPTDEVVERDGAYVVVLDEGEASEVVADDLGVEPDAIYDTAVDGFAAHLDDDELARVEDDPAVDYVVADVVVPLLAQEVPSGVRRVFAPDNPSVAIDGADRRVDVDAAVLDGGVGYHPDLVVVDRVDCLDGGGCRPGGFPTDVVHGTHVAGTMAAVDDGDGVVGVAPGARIWSQQVCDALGCPLSAIVAGLDYVTAHADEIEVVNMSLGGPDGDWNEPLDEAITAAVDAGVVVVAAAGNSGVDAAGIAPANHPDVVAVGALADLDGAPGGAGSGGCIDEVDDTLASFSNWGPTVDIVAPGVCIASTGHGPDPVTYSGTSMAAPHVTGAMALLLSDYDPTNRTDVLVARLAVVQAGNTDWTWESRGPGDVKRPLLDVHDAGQFTAHLVDAPASTWAAGAPPLDTAGAVGAAQAQCPTDRTGVYRFGGLTGASWAPTAQAARYDTVTDEWTELAPYPGGPLGAGAVAACTDDGTIHVFGAGGASSTRHDTYDTFTDTWTAAAPLDRPADFAAAAAAGGRVFVAGGSSGYYGAPSSRVDVYDIGAGTWTPGPALPGPRSRTAFAQTADALYLVGGTDGPGAPVATSLRLDLAGGAWTQGPALAGGRADAALAVTGETLHLVGGVVAGGSGLVATGDTARLGLGAWPAGSWAAGDPLPSPLALVGMACGSAGTSASLAVFGGAAYGRPELRRNETWRGWAHAEPCAKTGDAVPGGLGMPAATTCPDEPGVLYRAGGLGVDYTGSWQQAYRDEGTTHERLADLPAPVMAAGAACADDGMVHVLGQGARGPTTAHHAYDRSTDSWTTLAPLPRYAMRAAVGAWDGKIWVVGGGRSIGNDDQLSDAVDVYDVATDTWSSAAPVDEPVAGAATAQAGRYLYLVGGDVPDTEAGALSGRTRRLDMATGTWEDGPELARARADAVAAATDGALYVAGGRPDDPQQFPGTRDVDRLDLGAWPAGAWESRPGLHAATTLASAVCVDRPGGSLMWVIGGLRQTGSVPGIVSAAQLVATEPGEGCA